MQVPRFSAHLLPLANQVNFFGLGEKSVAFKPQPTLVYDTGGDPATYHD